MSLESPFQRHQTSCVVLFNCGPKQERERERDGEGEREMGRERGRKEIQLLTPPLFNKINAFHAPKVLSHKAVSSGHRDSFCVLLHQMDLAQILKFPPNSSLFTLHSSCYIILTLTLTSLITYYGRILSVLYCKLITEGMLAYKLKLYIMAHLWEPCFPGNEH